MAEAPSPDPVARELRVISADTLVAGIHFLADARPEDIAAKGLAVNLSDLASMGASPLSVSLVIVNPARESAWLEEFLEIFATRCRHYRVELSGVNAVDGPRQFSVQAVGRVPGSQALRRDGARVGDGVYVSGTLGDAGLGLGIASGAITLSDSGARAYCLERFHRPTPRLELGLALRGISRCAIDVSDGLCGDLRHICERSKVGMHIHSQRLPLSPALGGQCTARQALDLACSAGDDYELCFTAPPPAHDRIMDIADRLHLAITRIGWVERRPGLRIRDEQNRDVPIRPAYQHFAAPTVECSP